jgi:CheY-like chemotaxis protein
MGRRARLIHDDPEEADLPPVAARAILVVEDDPEIADILVEILEADGHRVEKVRDGAIALATLQTRAFDLILSDIMMPGLDGVSLYRKAVRVDPALTNRFLILTGDTLSPEIREFIEQTGVPCLQKPFTLKDVRRGVRDALRARS